jgi:hypothetical protein
MRNRNGKFYWYEGGYGQLMRPLFIAANCTEYKYGELHTPCSVLRNCAITEYIFRIRRAVERCNR